MKAHRSPGAPWGSSLDLWGLVWLSLTEMSDAGQATSKGRDLGMLTLIVRIS